MRGENQFAIYLVTGGAKRHIPDPPTLRAMGFGSTPVDVLPVATIDAIRTDAPLPRLNEDGSAYVPPPARAPAPVSPSWRATKGKSLVETQAATSADWHRVCVRDPSKPLIDEAYLQRAHDSVAYVFLPWLRGESELDFTEMLRAQHAMLVAGKDGTASYAGASRRDHNVATGYRVAPGRFMHEIGGLTRDRVAFSFLRSALTRDPPSPHHVGLMSEYPSSEALGRTNVGNTPDVMRSARAPAEVITLPRVPADVVVWNEIVGDYISHNYIEYRDVPTVLGAMGDVMDELRALDGAEYKAVWKLLAEYAFLGAHAHYALGANFSLVMAQVNAVLDACGLSGISHHDLDYVALHRPFEEFHAILCREIAAANPGRVRLTDVPVLTPKPYHAPVPLEVTTHVAFVGDVKHTGGPVATGIHNAIEGVQIDGLPRGVELEVCAHIGAGSGQSVLKWSPADEYIGTRGQSRALNAIGFRLTGRDAAQYELIYQTSVDGGVFGAPSFDGRMSGSDGAGKITGLKLALRKRPAHLVVP